MFNSINKLINSTNFLAILNLKIKEYNTFINSLKEDCPNINKITDNILGMINQIMNGITI